MFQACVLFFLTTAVSLHHLGSVLCSCSCFNACASWAVLPSEHETSVSQRRCCCVSLRLCLPCSAPCHCPYALLVLSIDCQPPVRQVCACCHPWTKPRCSKQKLILSNLSYAHAHTHTQVDRQTHAAPPHIYLPWLAGLVSAHACTCWLIRRAETPVRQRKTFPLFTPTTLTRTQILNKSSCAGYKVTAGRNSGVHLFMTWYFVYFKSVRVIGLVGLYKLFVESVHYECLPSHFLDVSLPWLLPIVLGACFKMLLAFINHLSLIDWCAKPKINMVSEPSVCFVTNIQENPQEILRRLTPKGMNSQPKEGLFLKSDICILTLTILHSFA